MAFKVLRVSQAFIDQEPSHDQRRELVESRQRLSQKTRTKDETPELIASGVEQTLCNVVCRRLWQRVLTGHLISIVSQIQILIETRNAWEMHDIMSGVDRQYRLHNANAYNQCL